MSIRIGDLLLEKELITKYQLKVALQEQKESKFKIGKQIIALDYVSKKELSDTLSDQFGFEYFDLSQVESIPQEVLDKMPFDKADEYKAIPFKEEDGKLFIAVSSPQDLTMMDDINFVVGQPVTAFFSDEDDIQAAIEKYYAEQFGDLNNMLDNFDGNVSVLEDSDQDDDLAKLADSRPVIKLLNLILKRGIEDQASDIHFEPYEDGFRVRYRVDGVLYEMEAPPRSMAAALIARIKIISKLNISETRLPQDGRIPLTIEGRSVDLRVSTVPTKFGESAVLRILDRSVVSLDLHNLRLSDEDMGAFQNIIRKPSGIVLVTGPTGSGKTTTLYACLNEINKEDIKIITNEDPVEYNIDGLVQVPIRADVGLSFARSLRASLRQDPDVILIGEIRDQETAEIAIESSLTGHLVFSTLHTSDAPSSVTRMADMGVKNFLIAATLEAVIAQRLVRTICTNCKVPYTPTEESLLQLGIDPSDIQSNVTFFRGEGCDTCRNTRYRGRVALYEVLTMNQNLRELVLKEASVQEMQEAAIDSGMKTLREIGIQKIYDGLTTIDEVVQATVGME